MSNEPVASDASQNPDSGGGAASKLDPKKSIILGIVGIAFIVLIFWKVIPQIGSYQDAWNSLQSMGAAAMILVVATVLLYLLAYGFPF